MSVKFDFLVGMAGWEDRYVLGMKNNLRFLNQGARVSCFYTSKYESRTLDNRRSISDFFKENDIEYSSFSIEEEGSSASFLKMKSNIDRLEISRGSRVLLDISTMNRENIWYSLYFLSLKSADISFVYYPSMGFGDGALTLDPGRPRFLFKMSGEPSLGKGTGIVVLTGYDSERTKHFIRHFDPSMVSLGVQTGEQLGNTERNIKEYDEVVFSDCDIFEINSFDLISTKFTLLEKVLKLSKNNNVVITSLGPKVSSISCFEVWNRFSNISLAYIPVDDVSENYSNGIDISRMVGPEKVDYPILSSEDKLCKISFDDPDQAFVALQEIKKEYGIPIADDIRIDAESGKTILIYDEDKWNQESIVAAKLTYT